MLFRKIDMRQSKLVRKFAVVAPPLCGHSVATRICRAADDQTQIHTSLEYISIE